MDKIILELQKLLDEGVLSKEEFDLAMSKLQPSNDSQVDEKNNGDTNDETKENEFDNEEKEQDLEETTEDDNVENSNDDNEEIEEEDSLPKEEIKEQNQETVEETNSNTTQENLNQDTNLDPTSQGKTDDPLTMILNKISDLEKKVDSLSSTNDVDPTKALGPYQNDNPKDVNYNDYGPGVRTI